jgi:hypothetical protein
MVTFHDGGDKMSEHGKLNQGGTFFSNLIFILLSILGGLFVGFIGGTVSSFVYPVIIFPILMGFVEGKMIKDNIKYTKTRDSSLIITTAILMAVLLFSMAFYTRFLGLYVKSALTLGGMSDVNLQAAKHIVNYVFEEQTGRTGFIGYILLNVNEGIFVARMFRNNEPVLVPIFTWLYWLLELGVIAFISVHISKETLKQAFCENCNTWYGGREHIGGAPLTKELEIRNFIKLHDYAALGNILEENVDVPGLEFYLQACATCEKSASFLTLTKTGMKNGRLAFTDLLTVTLTPHENILLGEAIKFHENEATTIHKEIASSGRAPSSHASPSGE